MLTRKLKSKLTDHLQFPDLDRVPGKENIILSGSGYIPIDLIKAPLYTSIVKRDWSCGIERILAMKMSPWMNDIVFVVDHWCATIDKDGKVLCHKTSCFPMDVKYFTILPSYVLSHMYNLTSFQTKKSDMCLIKYRECYHIAGSRVHYAFATHVEGNIFEIKDLGRVYTDEYIHIEIWKD
jgi:hypothetical protein